MKSNKINNKNIMLTIGVFLIIICFMCTVKHVVADESITYEKSFLTYEIQEGDTLTYIAEQYATGPADYASYIREVKSINNLKSDMIHADCYLVIPTYTAVQPQ